METPLLLELEDVTVRLALVEEMELVEMIEDELLLTIRMAMLKLALGV